MLLIQAQDAIEIEKSKDGYIDISSHNLATGMQLIRVALDNVEAFCLAVKTEAERVKE